ncbi:MAG: MerR family transcriptional regulator [Myxococcales bacterium]|nr:MerR family transcriptional regulator [Myxococcales bacterium]
MPTIVPKGSKTQPVASPPVRSAVPLGQWPTKALLRIGELADLLGVQTHVVRFWTDQFGAVRPERSSTNRLLFGRPAAEKLLKIRDLLYEQGMTIAGARKALGASLERKAIAEPRGAEQADLIRQVERLQSDLRGLQAREAAARASENAALSEAAAARALAAAVDTSRLVDLAERMHAFAADLESSAGDSN